jgi:AraC-like DNA-binding protein
MNCPLSFSPIAATTSAETTEHLFQEELVRSRILNVKRNYSVGVDMNGVALGNSALSFIKHHADYEINCGEIDTQGSIIFGIGCGKSSSSSVNGRDIVITEEAAVITNHSTLKHQRATESCEIVFKCTAGDVESRLQGFLNRPVSREIIFDTSVALDRGIGANARTALFNVISSLDSDPTLLAHPLIVKNFEDLLLGIVLSLPSNYSDELLNLGKIPSVPVSISRAEEYIEAYADQPITIADILLQAGCSRKALFANFRKYRGYTPGELLADTRLRLAHERLSEPSNSDTVTSIAYESGFSHLGRFAENYQKRYGIRPSATLKRALLR